MTVLIVGSHLPGLAAATRLAAAGRQVKILEASPGLGAGIEVATEPGGIVFAGREAWADLFRAAGTSLEAALADRGLRIVAAAGRQYRLDDGSVLVLPTNLDAQRAAISDSLGLANAQAWSELLARLEQVWREVQYLGITTPFMGGRLTAAQRRILQPRHSLAELAAALPSADLSQLVLSVAAWLDQDPSQFPAWHAYRLAAVASLGRWELRDDSGRAHPANTLISIVIDQLLQLGVELATGTEVLAIRRGPVISTAAGSFPVGTAISTLNPFVHAELTRERPDQKIARAAHRSIVGPRWRGWRTLLELPGLEGSLPGVLVASPWSPAGPDSWAQLATGALAARAAQANTVISTSTNRSEACEPE